ncbi:hypothetical protein RB195_016041 [Necator americanus]|uniref:Uncharacterized protein n=2 Tax=Necator americanus TaxID=51031 RepID=W2T2U6_NECAM|nr:hypothetical protein NECAME_11825 [Necator americanus]ETN76233.1 hypothetical protein NECAME_11825 [Necator americanus]
MRLLLFVLAVVAAAQAFFTFRGQSPSDEFRVVNIPVNANAVISPRFRPYLKRRFVLPRMGMPTYVREGDLPRRN